MSSWSPRLPTNKPKRNIAAKLKDLGFTCNVNNDRSFSNGEIVIIHTRFAWKCYYDYNANIYKQFANSVEMLEFASTVKSRNA
jgi:hypothetical protein